jgi:protein TonB
MAGSWLNHDLYPMNLRLALPLVAVLSTPALFAQGGTTPPAQVQVEERTLSEETITVEPMRVDEPVHDANEVMTIVEEMPEFPGGQEALFAYIGKDLKYPEQAVEEGIEGVVFVAFVVETDGSISNVNMLRGIGGGCSEEALRVVQGMPNWKPGKQNGKTVRVRYNLPIRFKL